MLPKARSRAAVLSRRAGMSSVDRAAAAAALTATLHDLVLGADRVAAYAAVGSEPATASLLSLRSDILLPVLLPDGDLDWGSGALQATGRGLREPTGPREGVTAIADCDVVLVPALGADRNGNRLGRGGGSYDRALRRATGLTIAVLYDGEWVDLIPTEAHDVPVAAVVTPSTGLVALPLR
jgi:5-formyltetrahydrofolate cyclo-ligase